MKCAGCFEDKTLGHMFDCPTRISALEAESKMYQKENSRLRKQVERLRGALQSCSKLDKTPEYSYGQTDRQGNKPGIGQRWLTPKELAKQALSELDGENGGGK